MIEYIIRQCLVNDSRQNPSKQLLSNITTRVAPQQNNLMIYFICYSYWTSFVEVTYNTIICYPYNS